MDLKIVNKTLFSRLPEEILIQYIQPYLGCWDHFNPIDGHFCTCQKRFYLYVEHCLPNRRSNQSVICRWMNGFKGKSNSMSTDGFLLYSYAMVIDKPILELLQASPETPFEIISDGRSLVLTPVRAPKEEKKFKDAVAMVHKRFGKAYPAIAFLAGYVCLGRFPLGIERIEFLLETLVGGFTGINGTADGWYGHIISFLY